MKQIYLIPVPLSDSEYGRVFPDINRQIVKNIRIFFVENIRSARRFLRSVIDDSFPIDETEFYEINKHTREEDWKYYQDVLVQNNLLGIISESGMPGIADPGAEVLQMAHRLNYKVIPLIGPSSVFLALAASGLNGQRFRFVGYLSNKAEQLRKEIPEIERISRVRNETQIFIETPYRNMKLFEQLIKFLSPDTLLCVATDLTGQNEYISTKKVEEWRKTENPSIHKVNTIFLILA